DRGVSAADGPDGEAPVERLGEAVLAGRMADLAAGLPPSRWRLDHVPATPETMARRAVYFAGEYELDGASVLCLGDHDLTSLAIGSVEPGAELTVVDIDEPVLDHIAGSAARLGLPVTAAWADLRLCLPPSVVGTADLVFTDPPYTVEGMWLFLVRALEALRPTGHERIAFCFGTGERHLVKALEVQSLLGDLRLALEAMLPGFNRYDGAEAIGARSDLYICRPTKGAKVGEPARPARRGRPGRGRDAARTRIYTRGPASEEAPVPALPESVATAAVAVAGDGLLVLVGDGWNNPALGLSEFFGRVAAWATAARPGPFPFPGTPVINTHPDYGGAALRTLLVAAPQRMVLVGPRRDVDDLTAPVLAVAYDITVVPSGPGGDPAVVLAARHDRAPGNATEAVLRHVVLHPGAKVVNAWRDGLIAVARDAGTTMTKNEARARIATASPSPGLRRLRTWELPLTALRDLFGEVSRSTEA
ncbi:MAG TPA: bis-aminopropyl spermidine synthase family protein, partial [Acidimicrobiia bacterium]|nr:bis-aminopropyl spermidine synthase family protein [Acidimicrobiia bacterium]